MTKLNCYIANCAYNMSDHCCANQIKVECKSALNPYATNCSTFKEKGSSISNDTSSMYPNEIMNISCDAKNCAYNNCNKCHADSIIVEGDTAATSVNETSCGSFRNK